MNARPPERPAPTVSIGVPVYNGEAYLDAALASLLGQTWTDFEVIVCDNASTDATAAIAAAWAARDPRVTVYRNESNIGLEANFDRALALARGRYFRWAASDDLVAPAYLDRCVARLEAAPDAVVCQSWVHIIDGEGRVTGAYDGGVTGAESGDPAERFAALVLSRHLCTHMFGLWRTQALRATGPLGAWFGSDRAKLAELALLGRFVHVPEPLFMNREHPARGSRAARRQPAAGLVPPTLTLYAAYWRAVSRCAAGAGTRARCRLHLLRWWFCDWNPARIAAECAALVYPPVQDLVQALKLRFYGPLPQVQPLSPAADPPKAARGAPVVAGSGSFPARCETRPGPEP
jgi:glycosyltransferase involved in cell wall biosynthesis